MRDMTPDEYRAFLRAGARTAMAATVRADGRPHLAPVWFLLDGDDLVFTTWHASVKAANLRRDPRIALCVDDESPPFDYVLVEGTATLSADPEQLLAWATRIAARYMGEERAEAYGKRNGGEGELVVRVTPTKIVAHAAVAA